MNVSIITHDMEYIQGANRVTEKFIIGKQLFINQGIRLDKIFTKDKIISCEDYDVKGLGNVQQTIKYRRIRRIVEFLKKNSLYNSYIGNKWSIYKNLKNEKKAALNAIHHDNGKSQCFIIQGFFAAYYYLRYRKSKDNTKTIVVLHSDADPLEQLLILKPKIVGTKTEKNLREMFNYVIKHIDQVVTVCESETKYLQEKFDYNATYITNGIEDLHISNSSKQRTINNKINFVMVASVQFRKGQDILVSALSELPKEILDKIAVHIIGAGPYEEKIANMIIDNNLQSYCTMYGIRQDVSEILSSMDIFILPTRADTTPIAIIEALRAGLPVISTAVGEIPVMIEGAGIIIEPTKDSVKDIIIKCVDGKVDLLNLSECARRKYEQVYSLECMIKKYAALIKAS